MIVADSDVLIDALSGRDPGERVASALEAGALATTVISVFELESGARSEKARKAVRALLEALTILPFDHAAAERAATLRREFAARGVPISMADYLIAGICLTRGASLLTRNRAHFSRVPDLQLE